MAALAYHGKPAGLSGQMDSKSSSIQMFEDLLYGWIISISILDLGELKQAYMAV